MMIFRVNYVILIIAVKNYNYDYSFFVWRNVMKQKEEIKFILSYITKLDNDIKDYNDFNI